MNNNEEKIPIDEFNSSPSYEDNYHFPKGYFKCNFPYMMGEHHEPPPPSPFRSKRRHRPFFPGHHGPFIPPFPLSRGAFKDLKTFFILTMLADHAEGITGYQIQEKYKIPRSNVIRILRKLEEKNLVETAESVVDGRAQKKYQITTEGKKYLDELKEKWATKFAFFSELAPPEKYGHPFARPRLYRRMVADINDFQSKEDALDYFQGYRSSLKKRINKTQRRLDVLMSAKTEVDTIVQKIGESDDLKKDELKELLEKIKKKIMEPEEE
ncbi:MAG: MarR family transcriptional regulator [Candidatus Heimdallarchaeota archaeon]|nr:MAG: MarR family transcriptional regulator [Candidatus Heimdallarchaeota archaeon]